MRKGISKNSASIAKKLIEELSKIFSKINRKYPEQQNI